MKKRFSGALVALCVVFALGILGFGGKALAEKLSSDIGSRNTLDNTGIRLVEIDGKGYTSFESAIKAVKEGQTIKLMVADHTLYSPIVIPEEISTSFAFDLNGYTLSGVQGVIKHRGSGALTIKDSKNYRSAKLTTSSQNSNTVEVIGEGSLVVESGTIEHASRKEIFYAAIGGYGGNVYIKGGTVRAVSGCAVLAQLTTHVNITGGEVSAQDGIAVFLTSWGGSCR